MTTNDFPGSPGSGSAGPGGEHPGARGAGRPPIGRPLRRSTDDRVVAGVAGGLGHWLDVDPVILRVLFAVLSIFGGIGVALYGVCWLLIPEPGDRRSIVEGWLAESRFRHRPARTVLLAAIAAVVVIAAATHDVNGAAVLLAVVAVAVLVARSRSGYGAVPVGGPPRGAAAATATAPPPMTAPTVPYGSAPGAAPGDADTADLGDRTDDTDYLHYPGGAHTPDAPGPARRRRARRLSITRPVLGAALVAAGIALLVDRTGAGDLTTTQLLAIPLAVLGTALLAGAATGRSWVGMGVGALLTVAVLVSAATHGHFGGDDVTWAPGAAAAPSGSYHLDAGHARLDLTSAGSLAGRRVAADVGAGLLEVVVPPGTPVRIVADAGAGSLDLFGAEHNGLGVHRTLTDGAFDQAGGLDLDLHVGVGRVEVTRG